MDTHRGAHPESAFDRKLTMELLSNPLLPRRVSDNAQRFYWTVKVTKR